MELKGQFSATPKSSICPLSKENNYGNVKFKGLLCQIKEEEKIINKNLILVCLVFMFLTACSNTPKDPEIFSTNKKEKEIESLIFKELDKQKVDVVVAYGISTETHSVNLGIRTSKEDFDSTKQNLEKIVNKTLTKNGIEGLAVNIKKK
ncbi:MULTISPECIES: hypothetical protein [Peribacillus]|uniref:hypothetical protein n=1 Tax=Peribacillus TaxID=2675229 RepID=UPI001F4ED819|nr:MULTISPECIES: hypothetical protein [unclassified Peribacillus]MCK1982625.1 hypothetical protein [Peribacillus sp. Aquil_B1]MCK2008134.1 hypothetical protein [Peribacillus sp. Aquil_B8]